MLVISYARLFFADSRTGFDFVDHNAIIGELRNIQIHPAILFDGCKNFNVIFLKKPWSTPGNDTWPYFVRCSYQISFEQLARASEVCR